MRDRLLGVVDATPKAQVNRDYYFQKRSSNPAPLDSYLLAATNGSAGKQALKELSARLHLSQLEAAAYRNKPFLCSFFMKGECNRGETCPYSHDVLAESEMNRTKIMNRYFGLKDPLAESILENAGPLPPALHDKSITSIVLQPLDWALVKEKDIRPLFTVFGDIASVVFLKEEKIAFVNFLKRDAADAAVEAYLDSGIVVGDALIGVAWAYGKPRGVAVDYNDDQLASFARNSEKLAKDEPEPALLHAESFCDDLPGSSSIKYSSMDGHQLGSVSKRFK